MPELYTDQLSIVGGRTLKGKVRLSGAKNSALKVLCAACMTHERVKLLNMPFGIYDVRIMLEMLKSVGVQFYVEDRAKNAITIDSSSMNRWDVQSPSGRSVRTSLLLLGTLLSRFGKARVPLPGGDKIGVRKYNLHVYALKQFGVKFRRASKGYLEAKCDGLKGAEIEFPIRTTGGTENAIFCGCLAQGTTVIKNAYTRPEVIDLIKCLNSMGGKIDVVGSGYIEIQGVSRLHGTSYSIMPDPVEAFTFITATAVTGGEVEIESVPIHALEIPIIYLKDIGVDFQTFGTNLWVSRKKKLTGFEVSTGVHPGINSDFQPLFGALATQAEGLSKITETQFKERFQYLTELRKMGADIVKKNNSIIVRGKTKLKGAGVIANDIRAGAALIVAGLCAEGRTLIKNTYEIDRGYEQVEIKFRNLGADIARTKG